MSRAFAHVVIGMDPRKRSVTIEVMSGDGSPSGQAGSAPTGTGWPRC